MQEIVLKQVNKSYDGKKVLDGVDLTFADGERLALMGPSGIGKTTLAGIILGTVRPDSGQVTGNEADSFACVFQEDRLCEDFDALTNVKIAIRRRRKGSRMPEDREIAAELGLLGIEESEGKPTGQFSGGMKRRVAIVRAMMADADTVIMDEPFKGLDEDLKNKVIGYISQRLGKRRLLLVTHDASEAEALGCRIFTL